MAFIPLTIDAVRLCDGLSRAGYAPSHSIISLIENAVTAGAKKITAVIVPMSEEHRNVREYLVIDDGNGMDRAGIKNALILGSFSPQQVEGVVPISGFGLKYAAFSQGDTLEVLSSSMDFPFVKYRVSLDEVRIRGVYGAEQLNLTGEDEALIREYLHEGHGTIVRITCIRQSNNCSIETTMAEVSRRINDLYSPHYLPQIKVLSR